MVGRVVEIETDGRHLSIHRGFLIVAEHGEEMGRVPLDDIAAVVANAHGLTYTNNALVELTARGVPIVLCGRNHMPAAIVWPVDAHHMQTGRMNDQISASLPLKKRLWAQLVRAKILAQGAALAAAGASERRLLSSVAQGAIGRSRECRGRGGKPLLAASVWTEFPRDQDGGGINGLLNYGYAVLRAGMARAVMAAGLHPSFGLMHSNRSNPMVLIDDLMEPFRPTVDREVRRLVAAATRKWIATPRWSWRASW